jgi:peptidoglycan/xylan/chitin deacetylase (PgdA/CDA1 family)
MHQVITKAKDVAKQIVRHGAAVGGPHRWPSTRARLWILMYHRILPAEDSRSALEEPGMQVSPPTFRRHLEWLRKRFEIVALSDWIARARNGQSLPRRAVAITFDDGWRDNYEYAYPILEALRVPATLFAVSHMIGTSDAFWPNRLTHLLQRHGVAATAQATGLGWLPGVLADGPQTSEATSAVIAACKRLPDAELRERLERAERVLQIAPCHPAPLMDWSQLNELANSGLVEIGSHTCRHTRLSEALPADATAQEILQSQALLEQRLGRPVRLFCYPNGDVSPAALALVRAHYDAAVTTRLGINDATTPLHELRRVGIHEDIARTPHAFFARLSTWV